MSAARGVRSSSVVGIDLGGTKVAVTEKRGEKVSEPLIEHTERDSTEALLAQLVAMVERVATAEVGAVGIGVPSVVDFRSGRVVSSVNIPLKDLPLREVLGGRLKVPVYVDNDATVAALAEAHDERGRLVARNLVMFTVGTGVGGGIVLEGRIYRGATGGAGELGHTMVALKMDDGVPQGEGQLPHPGSLERMAAGRALDALARDVAAEEPEGALGRQARTGQSVTGAEAVQAAREGDAAAGRIVEMWSQRLGVGIANAINTFDPEEVVIGGGGAQAGDLLLEPARRIALSYVVPGLGRETTIRLARHGVRAGVLGAALLAEHELKEEHH